MTTPSPSPRLPFPSKRAQMSFLFLFHALVSGGFIVAYLTGDEDTYGMHLFAGYTVLIAVAVRLALGLIAPDGSPLRLPHPSRAALGQWLGWLVRGDSRAWRGRPAVLSWMAALLLAALALVTVSGVAADAVSKLEHLHEALSTLGLWLIVGHVAVVFGLHGLKHLQTAAPAPSPVHPTSTHGATP